MNPVVDQPMQRQLQRDGDALLDHARVFERAPIGMVISIDDLMCVCNLETHRLFGYAAGELSSKPLSLIYPITDESGAPERAAASHPSPPWQRILQKKNGMTFWCQITHVLQQISPSPIRIWTFQEVDQQKSPSEMLSTREKQLATSILSGKTSRNIAADIGLSVRTVEYYRQRLMRKLSVSNHTELILRLARLTYR